MGNALRDKGKLDQAIKAYNNALSIKPENADVYRNLGFVLQNAIFLKPDKNLQNTISSMLDKKTCVRPVNVSTAAISLLKCEPSLRQQLKLVNDPEPNLLNILEAINEFPLLMKLMSLCPIPDLEIEKFLRSLRKYILFHISSLKVSSPQLLRFQSALALQCFTNEYIYNSTEEEENTSIMGN